MRKNKFTHFKRLRDNGNGKGIKLLQPRPKNQGVRSVDYDPSLFPINLPLEHLEERFDNIEVPDILRNKFYNQGLRRLGELQGLLPVNILAWPRFGANYFRVFCEFLSQLRKKGPTKLSVPILEKMHKQDFQNDTLKFQIDKLNLPIILKLRLYNQFGALTIGEFLDGLEKEKLPKKIVGLNALRLIGHELTILESVGSQRYLAEYSLEEKSFLNLIEISKERMNWIEKVVFDTRFLTIENDIPSLAEIARNVNVSIEGVWRVEKKLIKRFQNGNLKEIGSMIRRRTIEVFKSTHLVLSFESFLSDGFFTGITPSEAPLPPPINFLDKVFHATFNIGRKGISLRTYTKGEGFA